MRTFIAVIGGIALTALLIFIGDTSFAGVPGTTAAEGSVSGTAGFVALAWTFLALTLGAVLTGRVRQTKEAISGFIVGELFFGFGLLHQFWQAPAWYSTIAMLLVIPAALLGYWIASQLRIGLRASA